MLKKWVVSTCSVLTIVSVVTACGSSGSEPGAQSPETTDSNQPYEITMAIQQVGDIPAKGNEFEKAVEEYTNTKLDIQWIPSASYNDKINVMIASNEFPKVLKVKYVPTTINAMENGLFWEVGPYLKDYKNLAAQNEQYYENIKVQGKIYGIPNYREIGRAAINYRKDWMDAMGLQIPKTLDEWYNVLKAMSLGDPDKNGKDDTFGTMLYKGYNEDQYNPLTRLAVSQGGVNRWGVENGKFTPEFMTQEYFDVMKLFRRLYEEKIINQDFPAIDVTEVNKYIDNGTVAFRLNGVATNARNIEDRLVKIVPTGKMDIAWFEGPQGPRLAGEPGNNGILVFPKSSVPTEEELKKLLTFFDKLMDEPMSTLQKRGIEGKHYKKVENGMVEWVDLTAFNREIKPYRDNLVNFETYNVPPLKDTPLAMKGYQMEPDGLQHSIHNPALNLPSQIYSERGRELDQMIWDAQTKYIVGQIDDAQWQEEIEKWRKAGGDQLIKEYEEAYQIYGKK